MLGLKLIHVSKWGPCSLVKLAEEMFNSVLMALAEWLQIWGPVYILTHYKDVIMGAIASQITSLTIVYSTGYSDADQRKHQSSVSLAFGMGIHRGPVNSPHKWPETRKMFPFDDVIMHKGLPFQMTSSITIPSQVNVDASPRTITLIHDQHAKFTVSMGLCERNIPTFLMCLIYTSFTKTNQVMYMTVNPNQYHRLIMLINRLSTIWINDDEFQRCIHTLLSITCSI